MGPTTLLSVILAVLVLAAPSLAAAEDDGAKRELAIRLMKASGGGDMANQLMEVMLASMHENYASMVDGIVASHPSLTPEEQTALEMHMSDYEHFSQRYDERVREAVDFDAIMIEAYVPLYERYFTEDELRQILAFQTSPVGHKAATLMPQLMREGMAATIPLLQPALTKIAVEVLEEEKAAALEAIEAP
jgi:hypothetical protein